MLNLPLQVIDRHVCEVDEASVTFSNIDDLVAKLDARTGLTSRHLVVIINAASNEAVDEYAVVIRFNGDVGNNYNFQYLSGADADADAGRGTGQGWLTTAFIPGTNYASAFGGGMLLIPHAFNTVGHKSTLSLSGAGELRVSARAGRWANIDAITEILLWPWAFDFAAGSIFTLAVVDEQYLVEEITDPDADFLPTFDNIPQGRGDLVVIGYARSDMAAVQDEVEHAFNDGGGRTRQEIRGRADVVAAAQGGATEIGIVSGDDATALAFGAIAAVYSNYSPTGPMPMGDPHFQSLSGYHETTGPTSEVRILVGRRGGESDPTNKLAYNPHNGADFKAGSLFSLYRVPKRLIERVVVPAGGLATITFDNIPDYYEALILHVYARTDIGAPDDEMAIEINDDGDPDHYDWQELTGVDVAVTALRNASSQQLMYIVGDNENVGEYGGGTALFPQYARTDGHKYIICLDGQGDNSLAISSHRWEDTDPIIKIDLTPVNGANFIPGSIFELEGILRKEGLPADAGMTFGV